MKSLAEGSRICKLWNRSSSLQGWYWSNLLPSRLQSRPPHSEWERRKEGGGREAIGRGGEGGSGISFCHSDVVCGSVCVYVCVHTYINAFIYECIYVYVYI